MKEMELIEQRATAAARAFDFYADTFYYPNELKWEYLFDTRTGKASTRKNEPPPSYAHHCFVVVRSARQFFLHGAFQPDRPPGDAAGYRQIVRSVTARSPSRPSDAADRIAIPGFANLRQFSAARADLLRQNCGGAWQSYAQRGNWRMILPFTRGGQARMALDLQKALASRRLPIIHVVTFPRLTINHVLLIFAVFSSSAGVEFHCYDPNICEKPLVLVYDNSRRTFTFPRTHYFPGGRVNVYEIYRGWFL